MKVKISLKNEKRNLQFEGLLFLYFIFVFAHDAIPYVKFLFWMIIAALAVYNLFLRTSPIVSKVNCIHAFLWYGLFLVWVLLSYLWSTFSEATNEDSTYAACFRIAMVVIAIMIYCNNRQKCSAVLRVFFVAVLYTIVVATITSPVLTFGTTSFGGVTSLHRNNIGGIAAIASFSLFYYGQMSKNKATLLLSILPAAIMFITGSRGALITLVFMLTIYAITANKGGNRLKSVFAVVGLFAVGIYIIANNSFLNKLFGTRLLAVFTDRYSDASVYDRSWYVVVGFEMFKQKPFFGWGPNNFAIYLERIAGYGRAVYSHNNYIEIMCNYGIVGLVMYYWLYIKQLVRACKIRNDSFMRYFLIILLRYLLSDYTGITYLEYDFVYLLAIVFAGISVIYYDRKKSYEVPNG